jgi:hypothetical protein
MLITKKKLLFSIYEMQLLSTVVVVIVDHTNITSIANRTRIGWVINFLKDIVHHLELIDICMCCGVLVDWLMLLDMALVMLYQIKIYYYLVYVVVVVVVICVLFDHSLCSIKHS